jgi:TusA-related sulfurtransferase
MSVKNEKHALEKWMDAQKGNPGFEIALRKLISFACSEWYRRENLVTIAPEEALARVLATNLPEYPLGKWLDSPARFAPEIADFCERTKVDPLPEALKGGVPTLLDLRGVVCPNNSMRSRLVMAGLPEGAELEIYLDEGSPLENVPGALVADGHVVKKRQKKEGFWSISVVKRPVRV